MALTEELNHGVVTGGVHHGRHKASTIVVRIDFADDVPPDIRSKTAILAQLKFVESDIRALLSSSRHKSGLRRAAFSKGLEGVQIHISGDSLIPSYKDLLESFTRFRYGNIQPSRGEVSPMNFLYIYEEFYRPKDVGTGYDDNGHIYLNFEGAHLTYHFDVANGNVRWFYPEDL